MTEVDGIPAQRHKLADAQPMPIGNQHHCRVAMAIAVVAGGLNQPLYFGLGEVLAATDFGIWPPSRRTLPIYCPIKVLA